MTEGGLEPALRNFVFIGLKTEVFVGRDVSALLNFAVSL